jgi:hypothetical protein
MAEEPSRSISYERRALYAAKERAHAAAGAARRKMKRRIGFSQHPKTAYDAGGREPALEGPRIADVTFEIGVMLALHLAVAFAVVMTLRAFGIA